MWCLLCQTLWFAIDFILFYLYWYEPSIGKGTVLKQETPCLCLLSNSGNTEQVNLTSLLPSDSNDTFLSTRRGNLTFYYHGCSDVKFGVKIENITTNTCTDSLSLCLHNRTDQSMSKMGRAIDSKFGWSQENPKLLEVTYHEEDSNIMTFISLICTVDSQENIFKMHSYTGTVYELHLFSPYACKKDQVLTALDIFYIILYFILCSIISAFIAIGCTKCIGYVTETIRRRYNPNFDSDSDSD